jgi:hypothetical protein
MCVNIGSVRKQVARKALDRQKSRELMLTIFRMKLGIICFDSEYYFPERFWDPF